MNHSTPIAVLNNYILLWSIEPYLEAQVLMAADERINVDRVRDNDPGQIWLRNITKSE